MDSLVGRTVGKYQIVSPLSEGGMAKVYKAYQPSLDRYVAIKVLHGQIAEKANFVARFEREASAVARLRHPNIVQVHDFDSEDDLYYMVMELIEGPTLRAELRERSIQGNRFSPAEIVRVFESLASAVDYAHSQGTVHRDLKPANIMFTADGDVVLADFGIARIFGATLYTTVGGITGTPAYMSPEQGQGERGDERSDVYSLGVILYEMLAGRVPYDADTPWAVILKHINEPLPLPTAVDPNVPTAMEQVIVKAMSKNPDDRYQTAGEMAQALAEAQSSTFGPMPEVPLITTIAPTPSGVAATKRERQGAEADRSPKHEERASRWVYISLGIGVLITLIELLGMALKGLRFLGGVAAAPSVGLTLVGALAALVWFACGYALFTRQEGANPWRQRSPAFGVRARMAARILFGANVVVSLFLILGVLRYDIVHAQPVVGGQLGIVVAQFGEGDRMRASARARELSAFVARALRREIELLPGLEANVTVISGPLVKSEADAQKVAVKNNAALVIWGWVSGRDTFVPYLTFIDLSYTEGKIRRVPTWYEIEIGGGGTLELSGIVAQRTSGLLEYILGLIYLEQGDYDRASIEFERAIALTHETANKGITPYEARAVHRTLAIYHLALGWTFAVQDKSDLALAEYEKARGYDPEYGPVYIGLGNMDYSARRFVEALHWYDEAVKLGPESARGAALYARGNAHFFMGRYEDAVADYRLAIEKTDSDDESLALYYHVLGIALCRSGHFSEGFEMLAQAQELAEPSTSLQRDSLTELQNCRVAATTVVAVPSPTATPVPRVPTSTPTLVLTPTLVPTPTRTILPSRTPTSSPTIRPTTPTRTIMPASTPTPVPTTTDTPTATLFPTDTPTPPVVLLLAPEDGAEFGGWNADVILRWSSVGELAQDVYYVIRIPYDDVGGVAEFWRKETFFQVPRHFSSKDVGFPDRHYRWSVQVMRCAENCDKVLDDNVRKQGEALGLQSTEWTFYWHPDISGGKPTLFPIPAPTFTSAP